VNVRVVLQVLAPGMESMPMKPMSAPRWRGSAAILRSVSAAALNRMA
jgi:hypothetical protein